MAAGMSRVSAPLDLALRRLRARLFVVAATAAAVGGAGALVGWSSLAAAHAQERNVHLRLRALSPAKRAVRVVYTTAPLDGDRYAETVRRALVRLRDVTESSRLVRIRHPLAPADERGTRVVVAGRPRRDVEVEAGRLPQGCTSDLCEGLSVAGRHRIGERVRLGPLVVLVVGRGSLDPAALADRSLLGGRALLLRSVPRSLRLFARTRVGTSVVATAPLDPARVHRSGLRALVERLRREIVRLDRSDTPGVVTATAPLPVLTALADRGDVARRRLLIVASEGAALVLAFAAFTATARRREVAALEEQLGTLGASRGQVWLARAAEALVPSVAGLALALVGLPAAGPLPLGTLIAIVVTTVVAAALLVAAGARRPPRLRFVGPLEVAAFAALGVIVWQTTSTGSLDPRQIAATRSASPILLLVPALAFFAAAVVLLRLLPVALRLAERAARGGSTGVRLAALGAARRPGQAAAVTTFLAVALGAALFSLDYRATLDRNARDQADFAAGAAWRAVGLRSVPTGTPALRIDADVTAALPSSPDVRVAMVGLPARRLRELRGWRADFSPVGRSELAHRLRPRRGRLAAVAAPARPAPDLTARRAARGGRVPADLRPAEPRPRRLRLCGAGALRGTPSERL